jgi:hypothetical protein
MTRDSSETSQQHIWSRKKSNLLSESRVKILGVCDNGVKQSRQLERIIYVTSKTMGERSSCLINES